jgi:arylsulfatase A-like enzyme
MAKTEKPNILIIWGDDIGWYNISAYNHGVMGYRTPNIDRVAKEGAMFTDWYGQQSLRPVGPPSSPGNLRSALV